MNKEKIKEFKKEVDKPVDTDLKAHFYKLIKNENITKLSEVDKRALFYRALLLDDEERKVFKKYLVLENMTEEEEIRYRRILPDHIFNKYFPSEEEQ